MISFIVHFFANTPFFACRMLNSQGTNDQTPRKGKKFKKGKRKDRDNHRKFY